MDAVACIEADNIGIWWAPTTTLQETHAKKFCDEIGYISVCWRILLLLPFKDATILDKTPIFFIFIFLVKGAVKFAMFCSTILNTWRDWKGLFVFNRLTIWLGNCLNLRWLWGFHCKTEKWLGDEIDRLSIPVRWYFISLITWTGGIVFQAQKIQKLKISVKTFFVFMKKNFCWSFSVPW